MSSGHAEFEERCEGLLRKHRELARGFKVKVGDDGLITIAPKRQYSRTRLRIIVATVLGFFLFKSATVLLIPAETYLARLDGLQSGTFFERAAAWMMQPDPLSQAVVAAINWVMAA
ncbi:MAG: hypothetical protein AAF636_26160 [Pseudomonadota bacterium]